MLVTFLIQELTRNINLHTAQKNIFKKLSLFIQILKKVPILFDVYLPICGPSPINMALPSVSQYISYYECQTH